MVTLSLILLWDDIYRRKLFGVEFMYQKKNVFLFDTMFFFNFQKQDSILVSVSTLSDTGDIPGLGVERGAG